jgi:hypothetical protein
MVTDLSHYWRDDIWKAHASSGWTVVSYNAVYAKIEGAPDVSRVRLADATAGLAAGTADFANLCILINWACGDARRGGKPRSYLPGVNQGANADPANFSAGYVAAISAQIPTFLGHVQGHTSGALVCDNFIDYSKVNGKAYRVAGHAFTITGGAAASVVGTQRRRVDRARIH